MGIEDLSYEELQRLFPDGSGDPQVAEILRNKRAEHLGVQEQKGGVIGFDGRVMPRDQWEKATPAQRRGWLVGSTCSHYEGGVPGMDDVDGSEIWEKGKRS